MLKSLEYVLKYVLNNDLFLNILKYTLPMQL